MEGAGLKIALNGATTMKADLPTDIRAAGAAGFDCLEVWAAKLRNFLKSNTAGDLKRLFAENHLAPYSINSIEHVTFRDAERHAQLLTECEWLSSVASKINCPFIVVVPSPLPEGVSRDQVIEESVRVLQELGAIAEGYGIGLAFEFLGQLECSVQTLELADTIVRQVARTNVGLVIDSFHFYAGGSTVESIEALDAERLFVFHINDAEDLPREKLEDKHRLFPGLGILPLEQVLGALKRIGYDRVISVEIFRPEYWERDPFEVAMDAKAATLKVMNGVWT